MWIDSSKNIHFIGIGGIGISALAFLSLSRGKTVTGSDGSASALIEDLKKEGAKIFIGHDAKHISAETDFVIFTEAINKEANPEYLEAKRRAIPMMSYFQAIGELSKNHKTIAVAGTHGKTTTTTMLGLAMIEAGLDPLVIVGTKVPQFKNRNIHLGKGEWFIIESCEYRRSFLSINPFGLVLTNCEAEHLDYYKDETDYKNAFKEFSAKVPEEGFIVFNATDKNLPEVVAGSGARQFPVIPKEVADLNLKLQVPGKFNEMNATQALTAAGLAGAHLEKVRRALENFKGTWRRMEIKGEKNGVLVMDDYGHHPTEVRATLSALKEKYPDRRLICVFQPHQYSRTYQLLEEFKTAFSSADQVIVPNIYEARDTQEDKKKINAAAFVAALTHPHAIYAGDFAGALKALKEAKSGDLVITMGAGNISQVADDFMAGR
jgi:UDP-N-acetylmuramate--alanine ligase